MVLRTITRLDASTDHATETQPLRVIVTGNFEQEQAHIEDSHMPAFVVKSKESDHTQMTDAPKQAGTAEAYPTGAPKATTSASGKRNCSKLHSLDA